MIIDCISDLHGYYPELEGGDLLIIAGDLIEQDEFRYYKDFFEWLSKQKYTKKVLVAGNHDGILLELYRSTREKTDLSYLCDSGTEFEGLKIWGSPWTRTFKGMNPRCRAFTCATEKSLSEKWKLIPSDTDILVTHSPPFTVLDMTINHDQVGSTSLMGHHLVRLRPKLWVFGHVHEAYGTDGDFQWNTTRYVNASHVNERYEPVNPPIRIEL